MCGVCRVHALAVVLVDDLPRAEDEHPGGVGLGEEAREVVARPVEVEREPPEIDGRGRKLRAVGGVVRDLRARDELADVGERPLVERWLAPVRKRHLPVRFGREPRHQLMRLAIFDLLIPLSSRPACPARPFSPKGRPGAP